MLCKKHPASAVPYARTVYRIVENFRMTDSVLYRKRVEKRYFLTKWGVNILNF